MAITPQEATKRRKSIDERQKYVIPEDDLVEIEGYIDAKLIQGIYFMDVGNLWTNAGIWIQAPAQAYDYVTQIVKIYNEVGWEVIPSYYGSYGVEQCNLSFKPRDTNAI
jgi:hypothetical protein